MKKKKGKHLELKSELLNEIGFQKVDRTYIMETLNGYFYYNIKDTKYKWYHKTIISGNYNHVNLDITSLPQLYAVLSAFNCKFKPVIV